MYNLFHRKSEKLLIESTLFHIRVEEPDKTYFSILILNQLFILNVLAFTIRHKIIISLFK